MNSERRERVFLIRIWRDYAAADRTWRGSIHDVTLGPKRYIGGPAEIAEFVSLRLAATEGPEETPHRSPRAGEFGMDRGGCRGCEPRDDAH